jgi:hypothetical protein
LQAPVLASVLLSTIVGTIVGLRLVLLASRTRQFPELAVGGALVCYAAVGQIALLAAHALPADTPPGVSAALLAVRLFAYHATLVGFSVFTLRVFGAASRWRRALTALIVVTAAATACAAFWASWQQITTNRPPSVYGRLSMTPQYIVMFGWMSAESLRYHRMMRRRGLLGLADPVVTNRFGVWGATAGASGIVLVALLVLSLTRDALFADDPLSSALVSAAGLVNGFGWFLTFMPPARYTRWLRANSTSEAPVG